MKSKPNINIKSTDLIADDKNFNKGSDIGAEMIRKSFEKFGAGRSILLDKNNRIIAGNKSVEYSGIENILVVETDGSQLVAVKRTDIDLDSQQGREMALADNASAKANIVFDAELIEAEVGEAVAEEWLGGKNTTIQNDDEQEFEPGNSESKIPLAIVLNKSELHRWSKIKEKLGYSTDTTAFLKLIELQQ